MTVTQPTLMKLKLPRKPFVKYPHTEYHENSDTPLRNCCYGQDGRKYMAPQIGIIIFFRKARPELRNKHIHSTHSTPIAVVNPTQFVNCDYWTARLADWNTALGLTAWTDRFCDIANLLGVKAPEAWSSLASSAASYEYRQSYLNSPHTPSLRVA